MKKSSYTKSCHCQSSRPQNLGILRVLSSYLKREESFLTNNTYVEDPRQNSSGMTDLLTRVRAFTLMELLVVVLIIGVLAAVAVPQYKKAVLKSRFSTVMPVAKAVANAQEVYYLGNHIYAEGTDELDVATVTTEKTTVTLSGTTGYDYVLAQRTDMPQLHYIMYQQHSSNYPGEIHCEADDNDDLANALCKSLSDGVARGKILTEGYTTYYIDGSGAGFAPGIDDDEVDENGEVVPGCESAVANGLSCSITTNAEGKQVKKVCKDGTCRTKTYETEGGYTSVTCVTNSEGVCTSKLKIVTYDKDGNKTSWLVCSTIADDGTCSAYSQADYMTYYDKDKIKTIRKCTTVNSDGTCNGYSGGADYKWDGNTRFEMTCSTINSNGTCSWYTGGNYKTFEVYEQDASGNEAGRITSQRECANVNLNGTCQAYSQNNPGGNWEQTYDEQGNVTSTRKCRQIYSNGDCQTYGATTYYVNTYENGKLTSQRACATPATNGTCSQYSGNTGTFYTYEGNKMSQRYCTAFASNGTCSQYGNSDDNRDYTYDEQGNVIIAQRCATVSPNGTCSEYKSRADYIVDEDGNNISIQSCSGSNINATTGECIGSSLSTTGI